MCCLHVLTSLLCLVWDRPLASDTRCLEILQKNLEHQTPQADIILVGDFNFIQSDC